MEDNQEQKKDDSTAEKLADTAIKNPAKALFWVLLIAITTLASIITFMYKSDSSYNDKALTACETDKKALIDSMYIMQVRHNRDVQAIYIDNIKELQTRINKQDQINSQNRNVLYTTKQTFDSIKEVKSID